MQRWRSACLLLLSLSACRSEEVSNERKTALESCDGWWDGPTECDEFEHTGSATVPGAIGAVRLNVPLRESLARSLQYVRVVVRVRTGQALPGHIIKLTLGDRVLQEAPLVGALHNEATFDQTVQGLQCADPCVLSFLISGAPVETDVPVPLQVSGLVVAGLKETDRAFIGIEVGVENVL
jgi:hypothetical protein